MTVLSAARVVCDDCWATRTTRLFRNGRKVASLTFYSTGGWFDYERDGKASWEHRNDLGDVLDELGGAGYEEVDVW